MQQRAGIMIRSDFAPQPGEVDGRAQFEQARLLAAGDLDGFFETGFRARPIRFSPLERDVSTQPMQIGKPVTLAGLLDKGETVLQHGFGAVEVSRHQQRLGEIAFDDGVSGISARFA